MFSRLGLAVLLLHAPGMLAAQQQRQISGQVTRAGTELPVVEAEVLVLGAPQFRPVLTNDLGRFTIAAPSGDVRLQVRAIGFVRQEITVPAGTSSIDVSLAQDYFRLSEVVVTGQATTIERRSATTAVSYVSGEELRRVSAPTVENALTGKVSGVNLQSNSGAPGGGIQMQIRGNNTILGGHDPVYVIDGVPISNDRISGGRGAMTAAAFATAEDDAVNRMADINPADIESIEILKGAAASSLYGSKAANGVVIITTKRGRAGRTRVNLGQRLGVFSPLKKLESRRWTLPEVIAEYGEDYGAAVAHWFDNNASPYFNHYDQVFTNRSLSHETFADVSGGSETTRYLVAGTFKRDEGIEPRTGFSRQNLRVNVDQAIGDKFEVAVSSAYNRSEHARGWNNNCNNYACHGYAFAYTPSFVDLRQRDPVTGDFLTPDWGIQANSIQTTLLALNQEETNRFTGGLRLSYNAFARDQHTLRLIGAVGLDAFTQNNDLWTPNELFFERPQNLPGESIEQDAHSRFFNWNVNAIHTYRAPSAWWSATTSAGVQFLDRYLKVSRIRTQNLTPGQRNVGMGTITTAVETLTPERTLALYMQEEVRLFNELLLIQAGLRGEQSSVNGDIDKYYIFPKASASYRFVNLLGVGTELKPRIAYGETGNQPIFGQKFTTLGTPQLGGLQGFTVAGAAGSPIVDPERVKEIEVGLDGFALDGRFTWELTAFDRNTTNLLLQRVPAPSMGYTAQVFNGGKVQNRGVEVGLGFTPVHTDRLNWVTRVTYTRYTNEVKDLAGLPPFRPPLSGFGGLGVTFVEVGQPLTQIIGFAFDANGNKTATQVRIGNTAPDYRMGFVSDLTYRAANFTVVLDYQNGGNIINLTQFLYDDAGTAHDHGSAAWEARMLGYTDGVMTPYIEDATFLKVREVSVGVELPAAWYSALNWGIDNARANLTARNLFSFQKYSGLDPEVANLGSAAIRNNLDVAPYPPSRSIFFNIVLGF